MTVNEDTPFQPRLVNLIKKAASQLVAQEDVWAKHELHKLPAERIVRHLYHPETQQWSTDETIVKMQAEPFTHGAMRFCYRMKKMATPPQSATNHRFHSHGWTRASNYVAKCYQKDGVIDTSEQAKEAIRNDILLQYEASHWANKFNDSNPAKQIVFIKAYAIEFPEREGRPLFAVERFIAGKDSYGVGFVKHNTNAGFVDEDLRRKTPQVFSAHSFYASQGNRLVADIQGVGDLYTDPQVLSMDYRFGDGDIGPRGMALFFHSFRHHGLSDAMGIPIFHLSRNERKHQAKYDEDELTISDDEQSSYSDLADRLGLDSFARLDLNRQRRRESLSIPPLEVFDEEGEEERKTEQRSNLIKPQSREEISRTIRRSFRAHPKAKKILSRTASDIDEVTACLQLALEDVVFDYKTFHRKESGELKPRHFANKATRRGTFLRGTVKKDAARPMMPTDETRANLGKVHFHLACLHGSGRFPHIVPSDPNDGTQDAPYDVFSVLFHLCYAAAFHNVSACLALARVQSGLETTVAELLKNIVPIDFDHAKELLRRAMESPNSPAEPKAAAGCLLFQILHDEGEAAEGEGGSSVTDAMKMRVLEDTLSLFACAKEEELASIKLKERQAKGEAFHVGDKVEANFAMEGSFYPGVVEEISSDGEMITVKYDDDGSTECLTRTNIRHVASMKTTVVEAAGPLSDDEALGLENHDEKPILEVYVLKAELAELKEAAGEAAIAAQLFQEAADMAMEAGKMQTATKWSLRASELQA